MFGKRLDILTAFGVPIRLDASWIIIAVLVTWSLAEGVFPANFADLTATTYWIMGVTGAIGLFVSIVIHELAHAVVARGQGVPMRGITLFIFGGVAEMDREPPSGKAEFFVAIAGPIASVILAIVAASLYAMIRGINGPAPVYGVLGYLAWINCILVAFNLVPAFPLDGGRVLRAVLWHFKGSLRRATNISSQIGAGFGLALILFGVVAFVSGAFVGGLWWLLLGMFLRTAAQMSYQQVLFRRFLEGQKVSDLMKTGAVTVTPDTSVQRLVDDYIYEYHFKLFPVTKDGDLRGCVTTRNVRELSRDAWERKTVGEISEPCTAENTVASDEDAMQALSRMSRTGKSRLLVVRDGRLVGVIALKDLLKHLSLKLELEEDETSARLIGPHAIGHVNG